MVIDHRKCVKIIEIPRRIRKYDRVGTPNPKNDFKPTYNANSGWRKDDRRQDEKEAVRVTEYPDKTEAKPKVTLYSRENTPNDKPKYEQNYRYYKEPDYPNIAEVKQVAVIDKNNISQTKLEIKEDKID